MEALSGTSAVVFQKMTTKTTGDMKMGWNSILTNTEVSSFNLQRLTMSRATGMPTTLNLSCQQFWVLWLTCSSECIPDQARCSSDQQQLCLQQPSVLSWESDMKSSNITSSSCTTTTISTSKWSWHWGVGTPDILEISSQTRTRSKLTKLLKTETIVKSFLPAELQTSFADNQSEKRL